jgi:hypothetical protein
MLNCVSIADELEKTRDEICHERPRQSWNYQALVERLDKLAEMFSRTSRDQHRALVAEFHNCAGQIPYALRCDCDYGALLLEATADEIAEANLRSWLYAEARIRAEMCAQAGTAGGESIARYQHVKRLDEKLQSESAH